MQARAADTRQKIIAGAAEIFDRLGFERARLGDIVDATEVTKGALYFHFRSKDELARVVIEEQHRTSIAAVVAVSATNASALEQIVMLCHEMSRQITEDPIVRAGIRLTLELSADVGPEVPYLEWIAACKSLVATAIKDGDVVTTVSPGALAQFIISAFTGVQMVSNVLTARTDLEERIEQMWQILLAGIVPSRRHKRIPVILQARYIPG